MCVLGVSVVMYTAWLSVCVGGQCGDVHCMVECVFRVSVVMYTAWLSVCVCWGSVW